MDILTKHIATSPMWHILYPLQVNGCCYIIDDPAWNDLGRPARWSPELVQHAAHAQLVFQALGRDVYASSLAPFHYIGEHVLIMPERASIEALATELGKRILFYKMGVDIARGHPLTLLYVVP